MSPATVTLHQALIRLAKGVVMALRGMVTAWETWLEAQRGNS